MSELATEKAGLEARVSELAAENADLEARFTEERAAFVAQIEAQLAGTEAQPSIDLSPTPDSKSDSKCKCK